MGIHKTYKDKRGRVIDLGPVPETEFRSCRNCSAHKDCMTRERMVLGLPDCILEDHAAVQQAQDVLGSRCPDWEGADNEM